MPVAPTPPEPVRLPSPDDPDLIASRRKKMKEEFAGRGGRASTELSGGSSTSYSRTTLG
jgi:hypothetical protein